MEKIRQLVLVECPSDDPYDSPFSILIDRGEEAGFLMDRIDLSLNTFIGQGLYEGIQGGVPLEIGQRLVNAWNLAEMQNFDHETAIAALQSEVEMLWADKARLQKALAHALDSEEEWERAFLDLRDEVSSPPTRPYSEFRAELVEEGEPPKQVRYRCPICKRDKFDRPYQPHKCVGGYRKKLPPFERVEDKHED